MITKLRTLNAIVKNELHKVRVLTAQKMKEKGYSNVEIAKQMGIPENFVRSLLKK